VFIVDFGLAKQHLNMTTMIPLEARANTDFRGTIPYASLNAHKKKELSRRDDLWSFFFMMVEFLEEHLPWKQSKPPTRKADAETDKNQVRDLKEQALKSPDRQLFQKSGPKYPQLKLFLSYLKLLQYEDCPDYGKLK